MQRRVQKFSLNYVFYNYFLEMMIIFSKWVHRVRKRDAKICGYGKRVVSILKRRIEGGRAEEVIELSGIGERGKR